MERWSGKTAVVTGACGGVGSAVCAGLAAAGLRVLGLDRKLPSTIPHVTGSGSIQLRECDISKLDELTAAFQWAEDHLDGVHVLVNCAGLFLPGQITDLGDHPLSDEELISVMDVNIKAMILCSRRAVASMKRHGLDGHIININSIAGHYTPSSESFNVYSTSKHGVTAFTASLANELAVFGSRIKTTSLSPGLINTPLMKKVCGDMIGLDPKDIADAILYVLSTPPHVNISELTIQPVAERRL